MPTCALSFALTFAALSLVGIYLGIPFSRDILVNAEMAATASFSGLVGGVLFYGLIRFPKWFSELEPGKIMAGIGIWTLAFIGWCVYSIVTTPPQMVGTGNTLSVKDTQVSVSKKNYEQVEVRATTPNKIVPTVEVHQTMTPPDYKKLPEPEKKPFFLPFAHKHTIPFKDEVRKLVNITFEPFKLCVKEGRKQGLTSKQIMRECEYLIPFDLSPKRRIHGSPIPVIGPNSMEQTHVPELTRDGTYESPSIPGQSSSPGQSPGAP
ncbi:MAG: hypothetical protein WC045_04280 [Patescibacteria group bacterium]